MASVQQITDEMPDGALIGATTTSPVAFWGATPSASTVQLAVVAAATNATDVVTQFNTVLAWMKTVGMVASA